jgi:hypothetical protein
MVYGATRRAKMHRVVGLLSSVVCMPGQPFSISTRFQRVLGAMDKQLSTALERARDEADHAGINGSKVEVATRKVLRNRLPSNLNIGQGIVYDSYGDETGQTDIIIANGEQPFTFPSEESGEYAIEGVSAVGDVKSNLTPGELQDCIDKATRYKRLRQMIGANDRITNFSEYTVETAALPPFFVIAHESRMTMDTLLNKLLDVPLVPVPDGKGFANDSPQHPLDAVCILGKGVALNQKSGRGAAFQLSGGVPVPGWIGMGADAPLALTLGWLHMAMPRITRAHSVVGQYYFPPRRQLMYMANKGRVAQGLQPFTETDLPPMEVNVSILRRRTPRKSAAKKGTARPKG